jgi:hypothetical protein
MLILGLIIGLILGLSVGLILGLSIGLSIGLILELSIGLILGLDNIEPVESFRGSRRALHNIEILRSLREWLIVGLIVGLIGGLIFGLIVGLLFGLLLGLLLGLSVGLIFGLIVGLIGGLIGGLKQDLKTRSHPNQGMWSSFQNMIWTAVFSYPLAVIWVAGTTTLPIRVSEAVGNEQPLTGLVDIIPELLLQAMIPGLAGALIVGFSTGGGLACIQHLCLRFILTRDRKIPWNYARFLNYCAERRLLQRIGGRYRFIHRELLDYFAGAELRH